ncbi:hypothetical protein EDD68_11918 [Melghiribacillus thermohalophilus]|uniref:Uncharacterized protein n=1 Tax=Melghiribacillus thermohalophilus TaxID=1324956 RepID=A0A4R3MUR3_9BACI|nr:hypothetical protein [Melghiribacillus thermohalophilus]TCT19071.1 hypothetical protein EDD68_11918 [Melghiribacillus thermohalophilus]
MPGQKHVFLSTILFLIAMLFAACSDSDETGGSQSQGGDVSSESQKETLAENEHQSSQEDQQNNEENQENEKENTTTNSSDNSAPQEESDQETKGLSEEDARQLVITFQERLFVPVDEEYRVKDFKTIKELLNYIQEVTGDELAESFVDQYYEEREESVYFLPQGMPPLFDSEKDFTLKRTSEEPERYLLEQPNSSDIHGSFTLHITIEKANDLYKVTELLMNPS